MIKNAIMLIAGYRPSRKGMEMVQVAILIAIAITVGIVFRNQIGTFVNRTFRSLLETDF